MLEIAIVAGAGKLPVAGALAARKLGWRVVVVAVSGAIDPDLMRLADAYEAIPVTSWGRVLQWLTAQSVRDLVLLGKVDKGLLFAGQPFDQAFVEVVSGLREKNDNAVALAFVADLTRRGFRVLDQRTLLGELVPVAGVLTGRQPTERESLDIQYGYRMAKALAGLDIGQTVVVKGGAVLAAEALEGTDQTILRGGRLGRGDVVVVKVSKPCQDPRFDIPVIGPETLQALEAAGASVLAFDAGCTLLLEREALIARADAAGIAMVAVAPDQPAPSLPLGGDRPGP